MSMAPSEYIGDVGTCVYGRVVLIRSPFTPEAQRGESAGPALGKGNKAGKGKKGKQQSGTRATQQQKAEIHFLGGQGMDEVLFMEAWADGATQMYEAVQRGQVYRIAGAKKVDAVPRYSTSKLSYFLRFLPPIGINTKIEHWNPCPLADLALHHPFVDVESLQRVTESMRVSLICVVSTQTGLFPLDTKYGSGEVCNAVLRQRGHALRCEFWRQQGKDLAAYPVGTALALHQVSVYHKNGGWEVAATEATQIEECPQELRQDLLDATNLNTNGVMLTQMPSID